MSQKERQTKEQAKAVRGASCYASDRKTLQKCEGNPEGWQRREKQEEADRIFDWRQTCGELQFSSRAIKVRKVNDAEKIPKAPRSLKPIEQKFKIMTKKVCQNSDSKGLNFVRRNLFFCSIMFIVAIFSEF